MFDWIGRMCGTSWLAQWSPNEELRSHFPARHTDYRDALPDDMEAVVKAYAGRVQHGRWTLGLCDMWSPKAKMVKHAVHIPCWDSCRLNPFRWRGICFGRNLHECYWLGLRQTRWTRAAYAGALGREYVLPVQGVGRHGYLSDLKALCFLYCFLGCCFSCGVGQVFTVCGNLGVNCGACYSCHAREKLRRRFGLPPTFGLPPGIDDCLVHFLCFYCSAHQELRELALRGVDGPGMHVLDVCPRSFQHVEGADEAVARRRATVALMLANPPAMFQSRPKKMEVLGVVQQGVAATATATAAAAAAMHESGLEIAGSMDEALGWQLHTYHAPAVQEMHRGDGGVTLRRTHSAGDVGVGEAFGGREGERAGVEEGELGVAPRAWSVAY